MERINKTVGQKKCEKC